ncbi:MAG TPA: hypothetical protein PK364_00865 [Synergistaceae bacterium]|nr:hypothetical protein [Synergistaceae bacterium]HPJ25947.1 hypothetical protein [Synergistaceae bacterium]HPQ37867.1 hypothetical protein [Synergistaceae bacterium]
MTEYSGGESNDKKIMFISLGVLCVIFLVVTSFVWSSVNRRNQELANSVSALESQLKTLKSASGESDSPGDERQVAALQKEVRSLTSRINQIQKELDTLSSREEKARKQLQAAVEENEKARSQLAEAARKSLAFQKEFMRHLEVLLAAQEELGVSAP